MRSQVPFRPSCWGCLRKASNENCGMAGRDGRLGKAGMAGIEGMAGMLFCAACHTSVERRLMVPPILSMVSMDSFPELAGEAKDLGKM